jgi:hypothetical protein
VGLIFVQDRDSVDKAVLLNEKPSATIKRNLRVTYAKHEARLPSQRTNTNIDAARLRLKRKVEKKNPATKTIKETKVLEGKRAKKDTSGGSGFKIAKKKGKLRLLETKKKSRKS